MYVFDSTVDNKTKELFEKAIKMCKDINLPIAENITFGLDSAERRHGICKHRGSQTFISISQYLVKEEDKLNTMIHELLHSCPEGHNHGYGWKCLAYKIYRAYNIEITRCSNKEHAQTDVAHSRRQYFTKEEYGRMK